MNKTNTINYLLFFALMVLALLWNLGITPLNADEPTRTVVAQELMLSKNWFFTTINGEAYYNKPPIYNWVLIALYHIAGSQNEFVARIPVVLATILMFLTLYAWAKKYFTKEQALLVGIVFVTSSRIWFYDSMLGLIDMLFGWLIVLTFIVLYELEKQKKYYTLFCISYGIIAICFLMKGMQAIAFQGMTLLAWFAYRRKISQLISFAHVLGMIIFIAIIGSYLMAYNYYHPAQNLLSTLWSESSKRTIGGRAWWEDGLHIFTFPIKNVLLDILPWGFLLFSLCKKSIRKSILRHDVLVFCLLITCVNSLVYWLSPETRGRYLFPHYALLSWVMVVIFYEIKHVFWIRKIEQQSNWIFLILIVVVTVLLVTVSFVSIKELSFLKQALYRWQLLALVPLALLIVFLNTQLKNLIWTLALALLFFRLGFDALVLPYRLHNEPFDNYKKEAIRIAAKYQDRPMYKFRRTALDHSTVHYMTYTQQRIIPRANNRQEEKAYYLVNKYYLVNNYFTVIDSFPQNWENQMMYVAE